MSFPSLPADIAQGVYPTGSRFTCNPPVLNTDEDYLVLTASHIDFTAWAIDHGYEPSCASLPSGAGEFASFKKGAINLIVTTDLGFYTRSVVATQLAKKFNLLVKEDRVALFEAVRYGCVNDPFYFE